MDISFFNSLFFNALKNEIDEFLDIGIYVLNKRKKKGNFERDRIKKIRKDLKRNDLIVSKSLK